MESPANRSEPVVRARCRAVPRRSTITHGHSTTSGQALVGGGSPRHDGVTAKLSYAGRLLMENATPLIVNVELTQGGTLEVGPA